MTTVSTKPKTTASKKKPVQKLKNVLAYPFPQYWPELSNDQVNEFKKYVLYIKEQQGDNLTLTDDDVLIGLSKVVREINRNTTVFFLLSADIKPKFIATQIINLTLSKHKRCKVLCIPDLKALSKSLYGIESIAVGYRQGQCPCVEGWIEDKQMELFPISERILNYYSQPECPKSSSTSKSVSRKEAVSTSESVDLKSLHLTRASSQLNQRAFIPKNAIKCKPFEFDKPSTEWSDFISFSDRSKSDIVQMEVDDDENHEADKMHLLNTIKKLTSKSRNKSVLLHDSSAMLIKKNSTNELNFKSHNFNIAKKQSKKNSFPTYESLKVNKIQTNPNKVRSKKKKNK